MYVEDSATNVLVHLKTKKLLQGRRLSFVIEFPSWQSNMGLEIILGGGTWISSVLLMININMVSHLQASSPSLYSMGSDSPGPSNWHASTQILPGHLFLPGPPYTNARLCCPGLSSLDTWYSSEQVCNRLSSIIDWITYIWCACALVIWSAALFGVVYMCWLSLQPHPSIWMR